MKKFLGMGFEEVVAQLDKYEKGFVDEFGDYSVYVPSYWAGGAELEFEEGICVAVDEGFEWE